MSIFKAANVSWSGEGLNVLVNVDLSPLVDASGASFSRAYRDALRDEIEHHGMTEAQANRVLARAKELILERGIEEPDTVDDVDGDER